MKYDTIEKNYFIVENKNKLHELDMFWKNTFLFHGFVCCLSCECQFLLSYDYIKLDSKKLGY